MPAPSRRFQRRLTTTEANRVFSGTVRIAASRSRESFESCSRFGDTSTGARLENGQVGSSLSPDLRLALMSDGRDFCSKNAAGTVLLFGRTSGLRASIAA